MEELYREDTKKNFGWVRIILIVLICEKIIQHSVVTSALYFNWSNIRSTVAVNSTVLMILGTIAAILFVLSLWGMIKQQKWTSGLLIALALFDILGEFVAQGKIGIMINVSFLVASLLLILTLIHHRQELKPRIQ